MRKPLLLPTYFKWIGLILFFVAIAALAISKEFFDSCLIKIALYKMIVKTLIAISLVLIILSKEKIEDEFILQCRYRALAGSLLMTIILAIINDWLAFLCNDAGSNLFNSSFKIACYASWMYLITFRNLKRGLK